MDRTLLDARRYTIREVVSYANVPYGTLWQWSRGSAPIIDVGGGQRQWSFTNIVEARVLRGLRSVDKLDLDQIREGVAHLRKVWNAPHPLADQRFKTDGVGLLYEEAGKLIDASSRGQLVLRELVEESLRDVRYESSDAVSIVLDGPRELVLIDPRFRFGQPFIANTSVPVGVLAERAAQGESIEELALDYELNAGHVLHAIDVHNALRRHTDVLNGLRRHAA